jgi:hypothetical protein
MPLLRSRDRAERSTSFGFLIIFGKKVPETEDPKLGIRKDIGGVLRAKEERIDGFLLLS